MIWHSYRTFCMGRIDAGDDLISFRVSTSTNLDHAHDGRWHAATLSAQKDILPSNLFPVSAEERGHITKSDDKSRRTQIGVSPTFIHRYCGYGSDV